MGTVSINALKIVHFENMAKKGHKKKEMRVFYLKLGLSGEMNETGSEETRSLVEIN